MKSFIHGLDVQKAKDTPNWFHTEAMGIPIHVSIGKTFELRNLFKCPTKQQVCGQILYLNPLIYFHPVKYISVILLFLVLAGIDS